jgi:hypothetical protein
LALLAIRAPPRASARPLTTLVGVRVDAEQSEIDDVFLTLALYRAERLAEADKERRYAREDAAQQIERGVELLDHQVADAHVLLVGSRGKECFLDLIAAGRTMTSSCDVVALYVVEQCRAMRQTIEGIVRFRMPSAASDQSCGDSSLGAIEAASPTPQPDDGAEHPSSQVEIAHGRRRRGRKPRVMQDLDPQATEQRLREIQKMVDANNSVRQVAERFDASETQAGRWVKWAAELPPEKEAE